MWHRLVGLPSVRAELFVWVVWDRFASAVLVERIATFLSHSSPASHIGRWSCSSALRRTVQPDWL